jgi:flagellar assembly protein FliH
LKGGSTFKLHYFPEIPVDFPEQNSQRATSQSCFQRLYFTNADDTPSNLSDDSLEGNKYYKGRNTKIKAIEAQAYLRGFNRGEKVGFDMSQKMIESISNTLRNVAAEISKLREQIYIDTEKEMVELALAIAKKIVCHEVKISKNTVIDVARKALKKIEDHDKIKIKVSPADLEYIEKAKILDSNLADNIEGMTFEAEETISNGGCVIEMDTGAIDARIEKQFQAVEAALRAAFKKS